MDDDLFGLLSNEIHELAVGTFGVSDAIGQASAWIDRQLGEWIYCERNDTWPADEEIRWYVQGLVRASAENDSWYEHELTIGLTQLLQG